MDALARNIVQGNLQKEAAAIMGLPQQSSHTTAPTYQKIIEGLEGGFETYYIFQDQLEIV